MTPPWGCIHYIERPLSLTFLKDAWKRVNYIQYFKNTHFFYGRRISCMMRKKQRHRCRSKSRPRASHPRLPLMFQTGVLCLESCKLFDQLFRYELFRYTTKKVCFNLFTFIPFLVFFKFCFCRLEFDLIKKVIDFIFTYHLCYCTYLLQNCSARKQPLSIVIQAGSVKYQ